MNNGLRDQINKDLKEAMRAGNEAATTTLRMLLTAIHNKEIEKRGKGLPAELSDEEILETLTKEAKKRTEAANLFLGGGREDLAAKEKSELALIQKYLPEQMSAEEIESVVNRVVEKMKPSGPKDFGRVMGEIMKELKGRADASAVSGILKKKIS